MPFFIISKIILQIVPPDKNMVLILKLWLLLYLKNMI